MTGPDRVATTARLVLFLEGSHDETLRERAQRGRELLIGWAAQLFERLGAPDAEAAAFAVAAASEGMLLHAIARHDTTDPRPAYQTVVDAVLSPSSA
jgi:hypothetical protein